MNTLITYEKMSGVSLKPDDVSQSSNDEKDFYEVNPQKVKIPEFIGQTCLSVLVFIMGASMRGNYDFFCLFISAQFIEFK